MVLLQMRKLSDKEKIDLKNTMNKMRAKEQTDKKLKLLSGKKRTQHMAPDPRQREV